MKFELEIEATPAEARAFLGLPDLTPLHDAWISQMTMFTAEGPSSEAWQKLVQTWSSGVPGMAEGVEAWQKMLRLAMTPGLADKPAAKG